MKNDKARLGSVDDRPLRVGLLSYRSNPHCGGQGVYLRHLSRALSDLGHSVEVISGPPDPELDADVPVHRMASLDLYNPAAPFRNPRVQELGELANIYEWVNVSTMGFPEPFLFGVRAFAFLQSQPRRFDVLHDNQSLSYGVWALSRRMPTLVTIHHPITRDRAIAVKAEKHFWKRLKQLRWYSFIGMQKLVARRMPCILTVSDQARRDIGQDFRIPEERFRIVPNGIDTTRFHPLPGTPREPGRIITTNSADTPLKGLGYLLRAVSMVRRRRAVKLIVVGQPKRNGRICRMIHDLDLGATVRFTGRISSDEFVRQYARASVAVVASLYEGFGLPAGEAMACGVPVISTTGGALPEVVGNAGRLVPPENHQALAAAINALLENPEKAHALGQAGYARVQKKFTWQRAAEKTVAAYHEVMRDHR